MFIRINITDIKEKSQEELILYRKAEQKVKIFSIVGLITYISLIFLYGAMVLIFFNYWVLKKHI